MSDRIARLIMDWITTNTDACEWHMHVLAETRAAIANILTDEIGEIVGDALREQDELDHME